MRFDHCKRLRGLFYERKTMKKTNACYVAFGGGDGKFRGKGYHADGTRSMVHYLDF